MQACIEKVIDDKMGSLIDLSRYFHLYVKNRKPQRAEEKHHIRWHL